MFIIVIVLFLVSVAITVAAGFGIKEAILGNALDSLQVVYGFERFGTVSNPLFFTSKLLDAAIFPILTVLLATWFFDSINNINIRERLVLSRVSRLKGHVIVTPYNSFAKSLVHELKNAGMNTVVIAESKKELLSLYRENGLSIEGNIQSVETFKAAKIENAKCVVACSKNDTQNAMITITAKTASPNTKIIARVNKEENMDRLEKAGAHKTVLSEVTVGNEMGLELSKRLLSRRELKGA